jgi:hypothetical protein
MLAEDLKKAERNAHEHRALIVKALRALRENKKLSAEAVETLLSQAWYSDVVWFVVPLVDRTEPSDFCDWYLNELREALLERLHSEWDLEEQDKIIEKIKILDEIGDAI